MRRLIICCDGTWNTPDRTDGGIGVPTNVVRMARAIPPVAPDGTPQIVYYDQGVGTDNMINKYTGGAFGIGLSRNVRDAYLFLIHNYIEGDELYFFGFSRGAYTVRSTAGMIRKIGLLDKVEADRAMEAWRIYREHAGGPDSQRAIAFREAFSRYPVRIRFLGVWDTVGALGIPGALSFIGRRRFQFHDVSLSRSVDYAYQALAIDERRRFFRPAVWKQHPEARGQVLEQAWFPGAHMDVGGGHRDHRLADAALIWIADGARAAGLALNDAYVEQIADADPLGRIHESRKSFYRLIPAYDRPIGTGGDDEPDEAVRSNERLHSAAEKRYELDSRYRPRGLVDYLARLGKRLAGGPGGGEPGGD